MLGDECAHTAVLSELRTQRNEPHFRVDVGVAELVYLLELGRDVGIIEIEGFRRFVRSAVEVEFSLLHTTGRESSAMPRTTLVRPVSVIVFVNALIVVRAVESVFFDRIVLAVLVARVVGIQLRCRTGIDDSLILSEAFPAAALSSHRASIERLIHFKPLLRRRLLVFALTAQTVEQTMNARFGHFHVPGAGEGSRLGEVLLVRGIISIVDVDIFRVDIIQQLIANRRERARCSRRNERARCADVRSFAL